MGTLSVCFVASFAVLIPFISQGYWVTATTEKCLPVPSHYKRLSSAIDTACQGPRFSSKEFRLLTNSSVFIIPLQKTYKNNSYILVNQTSLTLCLNVSRNYRKAVPKLPGTEKTWESSQVEQSLALRVIACVGYTVSVISLLILLIMFCLHSELRTYSGKTVMHLSCAMIFMQSVYFHAHPDVVSSVVCVVMGALLHFSTLAVFLWVSVIAHNTDKVISTQHVNANIPNIHVLLEEQRKAYIGYSFLSWGLPFVAVGVCLALQLTNTGNVGYGHGFEDRCQLSFPARTYGVAIPVLMSLLFNIVTLIRTAIALRQNNQENVPFTNQSDLLVIVLKVTAVTGITWILGFALAFHPTPYLEYPFVVFNSFQGMAICFVFKKHVFKISGVAPEHSASNDDQQAWEV